MEKKILLESDDPNQIVKLSKLQYIWIKLFNSCNARCRFCDCWKIKNEKIAIKFQPLIDEISSLDINEVNISGGEVGIRNEFDEFVKYINNRFNWSVTTNGSTINENNIQMYHSYGLKRVFLSIDSHIPNLHNKSRGLQGSFEKMIELIKYTRKNQFGIKIIINHVVNNWNYCSIGLFLTFFDRLGVDGINLIPIKDAKELYLDYKQIKEFNSTIEKMINSGLINQNLFLNNRYNVFGTEMESCDEIICENYNTQKHQCLMPYSTLFIDCLTGNVYPCDTTLWREDSEKYLLGNLADDTLVKIWNGKRLKKIRSEMYPEIMHTCVQKCDLNNTI